MSKHDVGHRYNYRGSFHDALRIMLIFLNQEQILSHYVMSAMLKQHWNALATGFITESCIGSG